MCRDVFSRDAILKMLLKCYLYPRPFKTNHRQRGDFEDTLSGNNSKFALLKTRFSSLKTPGAREGGWDLHRCPGFSPLSPR